MTLKCGKKIKMMKGFVVLRGLIALTIASLISGCTIPFFGGYGANHQSREEFAQHVEDVFRLQNSMTSEVMMLLENNEAKNPEALTLAEQHMQQVCADLNEYASRDMDGLSVGLFLSRRVEESAIACEQAALAIKPLLKR